MNDNDPNKNKESLIEHAKHGAPPKLKAVTIEGNQDFDPLPPNVEVLNVVTTHDIPVNRVLQIAKDAELEEVVIVGYTKAGEEFFAANVADGAAVLWHLQRASIKILTERDEDGGIPGG